MSSLITLIYSLVFWFKRFTNRSHHTSYEVLIARNIKTYM
jgi:hypothetical protein